MSKASPGTLGRYALTGLILGWGFAATAGAGARIEREFELGSGGRLEVDSDSGSIEVKGHAATTARVVILSQRAELETDYDVGMTHDAGRLVVKIERKGKSRWFSWTRGAGLKIEISVPRATTLDLDTAGGPIRVEDIDASVRLDTSGGPIEATRIGGEVSADTSGGPIRISDVEGDVHADTSGGGIVVEDVRGSVRADTSGGSIEVRDAEGDVSADTSGGSIRIQGAGGRVNADTSGGTVTVAFYPGNSSGGSLSSSGGGVTVQLSPDVDLEIDASASGGSVRSDVPVTVRGRVSRTTLRGRMGSGGALLKLRSSGGPIRIKGL